MLGIHYEATKSKEKMTSSKLFIENLINLTSPVLNFDCNVVMWQMAVQ